MSIKTYTYLALGDSYTIGEQVSINESFPYQTVQLLRKAGKAFTAPEIVAKTGWTTEELQAGIRQQQFFPAYDFVSLLIGVNNQYRKLLIEDYAMEFNLLLQQAIGFAGNDPKKVIILSIPDWGVTPYAEGRDCTRIAEEIDAYNAIKQQITHQYKAYYINITPGTRKAAEDLSLLAADGLHPSGKEYAIWAKQLSDYIQQQL